MHAQVFHIDAGDEHFALLHVVITGYEVEHRRLSAAALSHDGHRLAFGYHQINVLEHPLLSVLERHMAELYLVLKAADVHRMSRVFDAHLGIQYGIYALHGGHTLGYVVASL